MTGDGSVSCSPDAGIAGLAAAYHTDGPSRLACTEGTDVTYPVTAPGYVDDPTGSTQARVQAHDRPILCSLAVHAGKVGRALKRMACCSAEGLWIDHTSERPGLPGRLRERARLRFLQL